MDYINLHVKKFAILVFSGILVLSFLITVLLTGETKILGILLASSLAVLHLCFHFTMFVLNMFRKNRDLAIEYLIAFLLLLIIGVPICSTAMMLAG